MFKEIIETNRLILRPFQVEDVIPSYEMNLDPEVTKYTGDGGVKTLQEIEGLIKNVVFKDYEKYGFGRFAVELKSTNEFIGFSGLKYLPEYDEIDLGYRFKREYWGKGIATESSKASIKFGFEKLLIKKIAGFVLPENVNSINVLEKLNFKFVKQFYEGDLLINKYELTNKT